MLLSLLFLGQLSYDPLTVDPNFRASILNVEIADEKRNRVIPIRIYLPDSTRPAPMVINSHGLGGNRANMTYMGNHLAARGYVAVHIQHPGSDDSVWRNVSARERMAALKNAATGENLLLRVADVKLLLDRLPKLTELEGRINFEKVGMSGHSFGAVTTQAVAGQSYGGKVPFIEPRIDAAIAYSGAKRKLTGFDQVTIPFLHMTGTNDTSPINETSVEDRLAVFPALPAGNKYELVLWEGQHSAFTDEALPTDRGTRNPNHHRAIMALSTAFWDSTLKSNPAASTWLTGDGAKGVLEPKDRWHFK